MSRYFAKIGIGNVVESVEVLNGFDDKTESECNDFLNALFKHSTWEEAFKTKVDNPKKNYPGIGFIWHADNNFFAGPQPFPSYTLNTSNGQWEPPTPRPQLDFTVPEGSTVADNTPEQNAAIEENSKYYWDEASLSWVLPTE
jgi:hypothetical protein|tara:strand:+ start:1710 stop:2135 length:426 start_codon:yes stop_codon:yes gene_type:complete